ncbi:hypothetical protein HYE82_34735 [Streptomyces sp. BR123]|nr:hypothetical protein [Streptomyces sp. BR123]NXY99440.1 hypothetical protein [Streptomyces sp. BR123]
MGATTCRVEASDDSLTRIAQTWPASTSTPTSSYTCAAAHRLLRAAG